MRKTFIPPPYVSRIQDGQIVVENAPAALVAELALERHGLFGRRLRFKAATGNLDSSDLAEQLTRLNAAGVVFLDDIRQGYSPAEVVRELLVRQRLIGTFRSIAWSQPQQFHICEIAPPL